MSILLRAAILGGIAYFITRSLRGESMQRRSLSYQPPGSEPHPGENHVWPTAEAQPAAANAGPTS